MWTFVAACLVMLSAAGAALAQGPGQIELLWLGQSAMRITTPGGKVIQLDPFITQNPKTPAEWKDLDKLGHLDLILVTHGHGDHVGDAPTLACKHNVPIYAPAGLNDTFTALGLVPVELAPRMNKGGTVSPLGPDIKISMTHADHSSEFIYTDPQTNKRQVYVGGEPVGFIIELENGFKIYHMGDTDLFGDMRLIGERYKPDLALVPIGGHFVMNPTDAAYAVREYLKPRYVIPVHYGTFPQLRGTPEEFKRALGQSATEVIVMNPGDKHRF